MRRLALLVTAVVAHAWSTAAQDGGTPRRRELVIPDSCHHSQFAPDCAQAFPERVECPATREEVPVGELCGLSGGTEPASCLYGKERCRCLHRQYCGGAAPTVLQQQGMRWVCEARVANPCPDDAPPPGSKCRVAGQQCSYGSCGSTTTCDCSKKGRWRCSTRYWAPPP